MKFGLLLMPTDEGPNPVELSRRAEDWGLDSVFLPDHTHVPASRLSPFPHPPYGELPREYYRFHDPFTTLAAISSATSRLNLGTSVSVIVERDPILTAKVVATLDHLSGGRVLLGVGVGWNREEMMNHGTDPRTRTRLLGERVKAMRRIWEDDLAEFHGEFVDFDPIYSWPKPAQRPLPVLIGGNGPTVLDRVLDYGDGWIPGVQKDMPALAERIRELRTRAADLGKPRPYVTLVYGRIERFEQYAEMDVDHIVVGVNPQAPNEAALDKIHRVAEAARAFRAATAPSASVAG